MILESQLYILYIKIKYSLKLTLALLYNFTLISDRGGGGFESNFLEILFAW